MNSSRRDIIREIISSKPFIMLKDLEERFPNISSMTLRRDIEYFEHQGEVIKVRGGARSMKFITTTMEDSYQHRTTENMFAKQRITERALEYIEVGRSIYLDSGTTMMKFAANIPNQRLTIITSGPNVAMEITKKSNPIVHLIGGMINRENISISGGQAIHFLEDVNIDIAFLVPSGLTCNNAFTSGNYSECELKQFVVQKARKKIMLMDSSKLDKSLPYTFANFTDCDVIITDQEMPEDIQRAAAENGVEIVVV